ncbi:GtrA family protein [Actinoplanes sp. TRM 88003]|uniref:GtrA family protein n=1 Tax=Paractinoplanes aksuensis TaxID=2939490 RepID=A0ABT1DMB4_9ACTN|nr:GtrA family protein [Actinoplanes aksuensis]MCO8271935.1 GtrA family protein [Actinoplanes aksuensis]
MPSADRLLRYGISGAASAATHVGVGLLLTRGLDVRPVVASSAGFAASVLVSYGLQRTWVFRSATAHRRAGGRFLTVTAVAFALNAAILGLVAGPYLMVQAFALVAIPVVNYALNSRWTFRAG